LAAAADNDIFSLEKQESKDGRDYLENCHGYRKIKQTL
jgi:hypothetical protein